jgi:hypothetical protein
MAKRTSVDARRILIFADGNPDFMAITAINVVRAARVKYGPILASASSLYIF